MNTSASSTPNQDCLFCKIATGTIPSAMVFSDNHMVAFKDIQPVAPVHILIIPRKHIPSVADLESDDAELMGLLLMRAKALAVELGISESGYRLVFNVRKHAGQAVDHVHLHVIGGKQLGHIG